MDRQRARGAAGARGEILDARTMGKPDPDRNGPGRDDRHAPGGDETGDRGSDFQDEDDVPSGLKRFFGGTWKQTARYSEAATGLIGGLLGLGFLGWLADRYFGTSPVWLLIGMLLGGIFGFYRLGVVMLGKK